MIVMINTQIILLTPSASEVQNFRNEPDQIFWNHQPAAVIGATVSIHARYNVPVVWAGTREDAQRLAKIWLLKSAKYLRRELAA